MSSDSLRLLPVLAILASCAPERSERTDLTTAQNQPSSQISAHVSTGKPHPAGRRPMASACDMQDGAEIPSVRLRAVGTEPFWGARIQGRCVTYSHPDDPAGTRVWTKFSGGAASGAWAGTLNGRSFTLHTKPEAGCSDGMSDRRYPLAVTLTVMGEERHGCAEPL